MKRRLCAFLAAALCAACLTTAALAGDESLHTDYADNYLQTALRPDMSGRRSGHIQPDDRFSGLPRLCAAVLPGGLRPGASGGRT